MIALDVRIAVPTQFPNPTTCKSCGKTDAKLSACSKSHFASYCGTDCQRKDRPGHKKKFAIPGHP